MLFNPALLDDIRKTIDSGYYERLAPVRRERKSVCERLEQELPPDAPAWSASGYGTVRRLARGEIGRAEAARLITISPPGNVKSMRTLNDLP